MKRKIAAVTALALAAGLAACATPTPYQPAVRGSAVSGGFSDQRLDETHYRVAFAGNSLTSRETVERYLLYRAAELTAQSGYDTFEIVERRTDADRRTYVEPDPFFGRGPAFGYPPFAYSRFGYSYWRPSWRYYGPRLGWRTWDPFFGDPFWADRVDVRTVERFEATADILVRRGAADPNNPRAFDARQVMTNLGPGIQRPQP